MSPLLSACLIALALTLCAPVLGGSRPVASAATPARPPLSAAQRLRAEGQWFTLTHLGDKGPRPADLVNARRQVAGMPRVNLAGGQVAPAPPNTKSVSIQNVVERGTFG